MSTKWFESWFDTEYYHLLYQNRNDEEAEKYLIRLIDFLNIQKDSKIIDIACGRGRHSIFLNKCGFDVTGIDLAKQSIEFANNHQNEHLHFFCHDKCKTFNPNHFDYALNLFTSFGYLDEREDLLDELINMRNNLREGGTLVLDYFNSAVITDCEYPDQQIERKGVIFNISKEVKGHQIIKNIEVIKGSERHYFAEKVHLITLPEFESLFDDAGLIITHVFGDYNLGAYKSDESDRLILIAKKS